MPLVSQVHIDRALTDTSIAYLQDMSSMLAQNAFPAKAVRQRSDKYFEYTRADTNRIETGLRGPATESDGRDYSLEEQSYSCKKYSIHDDVDDDEVDNADQVLDPLGDAATIIMQDMMLKQEKLWADSYFKAGVWGTDDTVAAADKWTAATSDPIKYIRALMTDIQKATGYRPNTLITGQDGFDALVDNDAFVDRTSNTGLRIVNAQIIAQILGLDRVLVGGAIENSAGEGLAESSDFIFGSNALLCYSNMNRPSVRMPSAGYKFVWTGARGVGPNGIRTRAFPMKELSATRVETDAYVDYKLVGADLAAFLIGVV